MTRIAKSVRRSARVARSMVFPIQHRPTARSLMATTTLASTYLIMAGVLQMASAQSLPTGGTVAAGNVTINQSSANRLVINQYSGTAITNWQSFSIGAGNSVAVVQPSTSASMLARVNGATTSTIAGSLTATGQLTLINPNGISITPTGTINAGAGFVATTLGISNDDFLAGKRTFTGTGASNAVTNAGTIIVGPGGYAALIGGTVANSGTISVPAGRVGLGSGEVATLDFSGDGFLQVGVPTSAPGTGALVSNSGRIIANGGTVQIKAAAARDAARQAINMSGVVAARSVSGTDGNITLDGGDGAVVVSGRVNASSRRAKGGTITVTGRDVKLTGAKLDASGKLGGGTVNIGGDKQGKGTLANATTTTIDAATTIKADATQTGTGGNVTVWSDAQTNFDGWISAKGGATGGDGGQAEVSSHGVLAYTGTTILTAPHGATGTLLLDPENVTISNGQDTDPLSPVSAGSSSFTPSGNDSVLSVATLQAALATANVTVSTGSSGSQTGDITVAAPLTWSANTLTFDAYHSIYINAPVTVGGTGGLTLKTNDGGSGGDYSFGLTNTGFSGRVDFTGTPGQQALTINGASYTLLYSMSDVANVNNGLAGNYALARSLDATGNSYTTGVIAGGDSSGNAPTPFSGTFEGLGHTVANLTITGGSNDYVGLIGYSTGTIRDIGVTGGSVTGNNSVGGFAGENGGTISNAYATGTVSGNNSVGGLAGLNAGTISNAYATGAISGNNSVGGLAGLNAGTISNAYATGAISGNNSVGGLVGKNFVGTISNAFATGAVSGVSGSDDVGGLVGSNYGSISSAYATGAVSGTGYVGGLVGENGGSISNAYATGAVSGSTNVGGIIGLADGGATVTNAYYDTNTTGQTYDAAGAIGLTTAQLQNGSTASGLGAAFTVTSGLYPYLTSFFPNGVQVISGTAYDNAGTTPAASGINGAITVTAFANGTSFGAATTGANGYYYILGAAGSFASGNSLVAYTSANATTGATNSATLATATNAANQSGLNLYGNVLTVPTTQTTLSSAYAQTFLDIAKSAARSATGNDATASTAINAITGLGFVASGASFTIDETVDSASPLFVQTTASGAPITVANAITVETGGSVGFNAAGALNLNAPITVKGAGGVALAFDQNTTTPSVTDLSFGLTAAGFTNSVTYTDASGNALTSSPGNQSLSINGTAYTLLYSMADMANVNNGLSGSYALAHSLDATGNSYTTGVIAGGDFSGNAPTPFTGTFEGLGHTISGLTVTGSSDFSNLALFGTNAGTIRDVGLVGASIATTSDYTILGLLVGLNNTNAILANVYATGTASATGVTDAVGGLVGGNSSQITNAFTNVRVSVVAPTDQNEGAGGLVGQQSGGSISNVYATGAVSISGRGSAGGLVGVKQGGTITNAYATGAVSGGNDYTSAPGVIGGLIGQIYGSATLSNVYATGAVSGVTTGGLVGAGGGTVTNAYYNSNTTGQTTDAGGATGLTTAQFQTSSAASNLGTAFGGGSGLYPYLTSFYPTGVQAISGTAYADSGVTLAASNANGPRYVYVDVAGTQTAVTTGANGYYYIALANGTLSSANGGTAALAYTLDGNVTGPVSGAHLAPLGGTATQFDVWTHNLIAPTTATSLSSAPATASLLLAANSGANQTLFASAAGSDAAPTSAALGNLSSVGYVATDANGFNIDQGISPYGLYAQTTSGPITVSAAQTLGGPINLSLYSAGALSFQAPVTVQGAGSVNLAYDASNPTNLSFGLTAAGFTGGLTFANADGTAATSSQGGALAINGQAYTLLYSMADVAIGNTGLSGTYALAGNVNASGTNTGAPIASGNNSFTGTFEGLGHTISGLTVTGSSNFSELALFGTNAGTIRDVGLVGASVATTADYGDVGLLVGRNGTNANIANVYATGSVSATGVTDTVGGLVGENQGLIASAFANARVFVVAPTGQYEAAGGLVGQLDGGTISNAYAAGAVSISGFGYAGGLAGVQQSGGSIINAYATGTVSGGTDYTSMPGVIGGLVGQIYGAATLSNVYATGAVSGVTTGGLVGDGGGTLANAYYDINTTGQTTDGAGAIGLTTAQFQTSSSASNFGSAFAGGSGLYPYLKSFYPNGVQAISGTAYSDGGVTVAASGANGATTVYLDIAGSQTAVTTGANGYYYTALPNGTLSSANGGTATLAYTLANSAVTGAKLTTTTGTTQHLDIWGNTLIAPTTATRLSSAPPAAGLVTANSTLLATAAGSDATASASALGSLSYTSYIATGSAGFTVDQAVSTNGLYLQTTSGPITVSAAQTLTGPVNLSLLSAGALNINAPIQVNGAGSVNLAYDASNPTNLSFGLTSSGFTNSLVFANSNGSATATSAGGALAINGTAYTLLYSMADVANVNNGLAASYALAGNLDATSNSYTTALIAPGFAGSFSGTFEGLGHTILNLTITGGNNSGIGLIGNSTGTIRDIGMTGGSVSGNADVGGLVGYSVGTIANAYATGAVNGTDAYVGGLVGTSYGTITNVFATGAVSGNGADVGGLVGYSVGPISNAYATGAVNGTDSYVGGLAGSENGPISNAYATGAVSGINFVGGLVGELNGGTISNAYATGAVSGTFGVGGLAGRNTSSTITSAYWDQDTSGLTTSQDGIGKTTAQLQTTAAAGALGSAFGGGAGLFPYLLSFNPNGVQAISGTAYTSGTTVLASGTNGAGLVTVNAGTASQTVTTGANGYYYAAFANGTIDTTNGTGVLAFSQANSNTGATYAATFNTKVMGTLGGFDIAGSTLTETSDANVSSLSALNTAYTSATTGTPISGLMFINRAVSSAASSFTIDHNVSNPGTVSIASAGDITIAHGATVTGSDVTLSATGAFVNNEGSDAVTATSGRWLIYSANPTGDTFGSLDSGNTAVWNTAAGGTVSATGNRYVFAYRPTLTVSTVNDSKTYGDDATTAVAGDYTVTGFQAAVTGAYLSDTASVYSGAASVTSQGAAVTAGVRNGGYAYTLGTGTLASSGYAFRLNNAGTFTVNTRTITVTADAQTQTYGNAVPTLTYTVGGGGLVNGDTLSGSLATSASSTAGVGIYAITQGSLANSNYAITYTGANDVIGTRAITVTADAKTQVYGNAAPALTYTVGGLGLVNGDTLAGSLATTASATANVGSYAITQGTLAASSNYAVTYTGANDVIGTRAITVVADAKTQTYGNSAPTLTYTVGGLGLVNSDILSGSLATTASSTSNVGSYAITQGTLAASSNYAITYTGANDVIGTRAITVVADAKTQTYGNAAPTLTYTVGGLGLVNGDTLSGSLATTASTTTGIGTYAITQGTLTSANNPNYTITSYTGANDVIAARAITVTANAQTQVYGNATPTLTYTVGGLGLVNGDALSGNLATTATSASNVGGYAITQGTITNANDGNYAITYTGANDVIGTRAITIAADAKSQIYGNATPTLTYAVGGLGLVNGDTLAGQLAAAATVTSPVGTYAITQGSLTASNNYALTYKSALLTVNPNSPPSSTFGDTFGSPSQGSPATGTPPSGSQEDGTYAGFTSPGYDTPSTCVAGRACASP